ncbi:MAG: MBL fold metallo-hydrolase [Clostridia bacterium]|nr:MBL fold metallo-hydrolase [Clostridia bacterium]
MRFIPLISSSQGNAAYLEAGGRNILIDAGASAKRLTELLYGVGIDVTRLDAVLVTHEHSDHVQGLGMLSKKYGVPVYMTEKCGNALPKAVAEKLPAENIRCIIPGQEFFLGGLRVLPFPTYHDTVEPIGFCFWEGANKFTYLTDCGHTDKRLTDLCADSDLLFIECNHDVDMVLASNRSYALKHRILSNKGHLSNAACAQLLTELSRRNVGGAILAHLSQECNTPDLARITVESALRVAGSDLRIVVANASGPTGIFEIGEA